MILIIDNYDSFTYNVVQLVGTSVDSVTVRRNDTITLDEVAALRPEGIILSPGPGRPENAGICVRLIKEFGMRTPILGVCLGHQAIGYSFGAQIVHAPSLMHGKVSLVTHQNTSLFQNISNPFEATRYHSLVISRDRVPSDLEITAQTEEGVIMGIRHRRYPIEGVQFHPESILTKVGPRIVENWLVGLKERV